MVLTLCYSQLKKTDMGQRRFLYSIIPNNFRMVDFLNILRRFNQNIRSLLKSVKHNFDVQHLLCWIKDSSILIGFSTINMT